MRTIETTVYQYDELSDDAKSKARDWYREALAGDTFFAETPTEEFEALLKILGFDIKDRRGRSTIEWSGFWSQGDGAAFGGTWYASDCKPQAWLADRSVSGVRDGTPFECKHNKRWHGAIAPLVELAAQYPGASASIETGRSNYMRLDSFDLGYDDDDPRRENDDSDVTLASDSFIDAARALAGAFYRTLETEYEYQNSDESVAENIRANEYEFTKEGGRI